MPKNASRYALITGCSVGGIGHALAREYHSKGVQVIATARRLETMEDLARMGITTMKLDVTDITAIRRVRDDVAALTGGRLDILVNNAGQAYSVAITDMDMAEVRSLFETNVFSPVCMVQEFVQLLVSSGDGRILQIGSITALMGLPFGAAYNASKAALHSFSNTLRVELSPFNIKVIGVVSGSVKSNIVKPRTIPDSSMYKSMEAVYQEKRINVSQANAMPAEKYAQTVVAETLKIHPRAWIWVGNQVWLAWFIDTFLGQTGFDWLMKKMFGLSEFSARVRSGEVRRDL